MTLPWVLVTGMFRDFHMLMLFFFYPGDITHHETNSAPLPQCEASDISSDTLQLPTNSLSVFLGSALPSLLSWSQVILQDSLKIVCGLSNFPINCEISEGRAWIHFPGINSVYMSDWRPEPLSAKQPHPILEEALALWGRWLGSV